MHGTNQDMLSEALVDRVNISDSHFFQEAY
jgi:hypothetical protein